VLVKRKGFIIKAKIKGEVAPSAIKRGGKGKGEGGRLLFRFFQKKRSISNQKKKGGKGEEKRERSREKKGLIDLEKTKKGKRKKRGRKRN